MLIYCRISINIKEMEYLFHPIKQMVGNIMHGYHIWSGSLPNVSNMATPRIIDAWTTLPKLRTWEVQVNHNGIITWKRFRITSHLWGESTGHQWATRQRDSYVLRDPWKSYLPKNRDVRDLRHHHFHITLLSWCMSCAYVINFVTW